MADRATKARRFAGGSFVALLTLFTTFVLLDTFVIPYRVVQAAPARALPAPPAVPLVAPSLPAGLTPKVGPRTHVDSHRAITMATYRFDDSDVYVADVAVSDPAVLRVGFAEGVYGRNVVEPTSTIAAANGAVLAINGAYYGAREASFVVLNGQVYRDRLLADDQEDLVITADGDLQVVREGDTTPVELVASGAVSVLSFGPGLVRDGRVVVGPGNYNGNGKDTNPRTAVAQLGPLHYLFVVVDGRRHDSAGMNLTQLANFLVQYGVTTAYNLDGGGSSTMWYAGEVVNRPTTDGQTFVQREISDIIYV